MGEGEEAGSSSNGKAEPTHEVQIDPDPKITTRSDWLNRLQKHREKRQGLVKGTIHKVPYLLRANLVKRYEPEVVSIGPYHSSKANLKISRELKRKVADRLVPGEERQAFMRSEIMRNMQNLKDAYSTDKMKKRANSRWVEMFFLDGCFVLHFIFCILLNRVEDLGMKEFDIDSVQSDLFLAENQLPFELLRILSGDDPELLALIDDYIYTHKISNDEVDRGGGSRDDPAHLLDRLRSMIIGAKSETEAVCESTRPRTTKRTALRNAKELNDKGIHFKCNRTGFLTDIFFRPHCVYGTLRLPKIIVDESTNTLFLNLAAYEMSSGMDSTITSYICFLDSLVNHVDDIKELQSAGVLVNHLATDELAANLFNEMSRGINLHPDKDTYKDVKWKIHEFFRHKTKANFASWVAEGYRNHFKTPLTAIAFFAAFLALALTATQTYFSVFPRGG